MLIGIEWFVLEIAIFIIWDQSEIGERGENEHTRMVVESTFWKDFYEKIDGRDEELKIRFPGKKFRAFFKFGTK